MYVSSSDESEPSWLKLNNFGKSARLVTFSIQLKISLLRLENLPIDWFMMKNHSFQLQKHLLYYIKSNKWS